MNKAGPDQRYQKQENHLSQDYRAGRVEAFRFAPAQ